MLPEFSVVIPTYQQPALLLKCLDALGRQRLSRDQFEIIVVDEGNSPETETAVQLFAKQVARDGGPIEVRYLGQPERRGPAAARNRGWRAARGRIIAFTDDDCLPESEWLSSALLCFQRGAQVMSGQLRVYLPNQPTPLDRTATILKRAEFMSSNCFCRKSTLERVNGFEEAFDIDWREDSDLQFKFIQAGIPIGKCTEAVVVHHIRPCPWYGLLRDERNNSYDALLYKRHPNLFRERIPSFRRQVLQYYASVISISSGLAGLVTGHFVIALLGLGIWALLSTYLIIRHLPKSPLNSTTVKHAVLTALATPFLSVYWRLHGAFKYKVLYL
ncbi:glycosyltransferase family 2 protein [Spirosoma foliorum]|uniref:Glycosyltransferase n=1 Tax=Spirosoma foliorum TaxID=2710596 RepID=A0A7G5GVR4_9BACT|nr:glycosyltransferase [Spirosoma foliorum]QMW02956.1 glycosyltransferase [Spirosoma foliorum]